MCAAALDANVYATPVLKADLVTKLEKTATKLASQPLGDEVGRVPARGRRVVLSGVSRGTRSNRHCQTCHDGVVTQLHNLVSSLTHFPNAARRSGTRGAADARGADRAAHAAARARRDVLRRDVAVLLPEGGERRAGLIVLSAPAPVVGVAIQRAAAGVKRIVSV